MLDIITTVKIVIAGLKLEGPCDKIKIYMYDVDQYRYVSPRGTLQHYCNHQI